MYTINIILFLFSLFAVESCKFNAQVRSETDRDIWAQFTFHNKSQSDVFKFSKYGETKNFTISGTLCNLSPTVLKSWEELPKKDGAPVGQTSAYLEGTGGTIYYKIFPEHGPAAIRTEAMFCSWGQCRLGK